MKLSQEDKILTDLKAYPQGLHPTHFIETLHIFQYNARINSLRTRFGCSHKNGNTVCVATEHIINKSMPNGTTLFFYRKTAGVDWEKMRVESIEKRDVTPKKDDIQPDLLSYRNIGIDIL